MTDPSPRHVQLSRVGLHVLTWQGADPPIVLLHPNRTNARVWEHLVAASELDRHIVAVDHRGHGHSDWPERGYQLDDYVADDIELLESLDAGPVDLVGAATGGTVALLLASERPELVRRLVVIDPGLSLDPTINAMVQDQLLRQYRHDDWAAAVADMPFAEGWAPEVREHFAHHSLIEGPDGSVTWRYHLAAAQETESALEADLWYRIDVRCPALLVRGADSEVFDEVRMQRLAAAIATVETVAIEGANHRVMQDQPAALAAAIDRFLGPT